jgi:hypothetical protein
MKSPNRNLSFCFTFDLLFEDDALTGSSAHVVLRTCSKDEDGATYVTPDCATPEELRYQIDRLQCELEIIRNRGVRAFIENINGSAKRNRKNK